VPTDTARGLTDAVKFALRGVAWSLGLFGVLRLNWTEAHAVLPFTRLQGAAAVGLFGPSAMPIEVTLACSGADALALCLGAILAYPVRWRARFAGAAVGALLIVLLNTVRIGTLGQAAASPEWFNALHVYIWPGLLTLAIAGYVFAWMRLADRLPDATGAVPLSTSAGNAGHPVRTEGRPSPLAAARTHPKRTRRFVMLAGALLVLFTAASPFYLESPRVLALAGFIARAAALILGAVGVSAHSAGNMLWTPRGAFLVTQECISTPLVPVYLAAVCAYSTTWRRLMLGVLAAVPLFVVLGIVRLLVVALPGALLASPFFLIHAFYQLLLAAVIVFVAARWRHGAAGAVRHALVGIVLGVLFVYLLGPFYTRLVTYPSGTPLDDPQGAIALLPAFQVGFYLAVWVAAFVAVGWRRFLAGLAFLELTQTAGLLALHALGSHSGLTAHVRDVRGWAVVGPLLIVAAVVNVARPRR
jgi:exosortase/archaeosortase family protein